MAKNKVTMNKTIKNIGYSSDEPQDRDLMSLVNEYSALFPGIPTLSLVRNLLLETLRDKIKIMRAAKSEQQAVS